ncbi:unnamed protein product [Prunus armeniaca]
MHFYMGFFRKMSIWFNPPGFIDHTRPSHVVNKEHTLHINQLKYAHDLLKKTNLLNSKPASTPLVAKVLLSVSDGALISNLTEYRELVGSL